MKSSLKNLFGAIIAVACIANFPANAAIVKATASTSIINAVGGTTITSVNVSVSPCIAATKIYAVYNYAGAKICPTAATRFFYVSASGNDTNSGLSPTLAKKTLRGAFLAAGTAPTNTWIVLKRGEVFERHPADPIPLLNASGISASQPLVITAYGDGMERPMLSTDLGMEIRGSASVKKTDVIISGLHIYRKVGLGGTGIKFLNGNMERIVISDNRIDGYSNAIIVQQIGTHASYENVAIRNNVLLNTASGVGPGGHANTIYAFGIKKGLVIENNLMDFGGYYGDRTVGIPDKIVSCKDNVTNVYSKEVDYPTSCPAGTTPVMMDSYATIFNHHLYLQYGVESGPAVVRNNIVSRGSSHGMQARSGADAQLNVFSRNGLAAFVGGDDLDPEQGYVSVLANNVAVEGENINDTTPRGFGFTANSAPNSILYANMVVNMNKSHTASNKIAYEVVCVDPEYVAGTLRRPCTTSLLRNIAYGWRDHSNGNGNPLLFKVRADQTDPKSIVIMANDFEGSALGTSKTMVTFQNDSAVSLGDKVSFIANTYRLENPANINFRPVTGSAAISMESWQQQNFELNPKGVTPESAQNKCRTLATYYDDAILGNLANDNCAIMHDDALYNAFMQAAAEAKHPLKAKNMKFEAISIIRYFREAFPVPNL